MNYEIHFSSFKEASEFLRELKRGKLVGTTWVFDGELTEKEKNYVWMNTPFDKIPSDFVRGQQNGVGNIYQVKDLEFKFLKRDVECYREVLKLIEEWESEGWRLPTVYELNSLKKRDFRVSERFGADYIEPFAGRDDKLFWTSAKDILTSIGASSYTKQRLIENDKVSWSSTGSFAGIGSDYFSSKGDIVVVRAEKPLVTTWCIELVEWADNNSVYNFPRSDAEINSLTSLKITDIGSRMPLHENLLNIKTLVSIDMQTDSDFDPLLYKMTQLQSIKIIGAPCSRVAINISDEIQSLRSLSSLELHEVFRGELSHHLFTLSELTRITFKFWRY
ncbi:hypothetical protein [Enterovibrio norvegicus]|uniref:hypothetical protein n=1 Tax=Enterovibrio norvegicus TaxID=188144 RepID=UPI00352CC2A6